MLTPDFRPSQLPEFTPPAVPQTKLKRAAAEYALVALAASIGGAYALLTSYLTRLALAPAIAIGVLLALHLGTVFVARLRLGEWLGLPGLVITVLAALAAPAGAGMADPTDHMAPAGGYLPLSPTPTEHWLVRSAQALADTAGPLVVIIGALISSWFAVHNARPR
jgi:glucose dehydrogenase